jgi:hypothetical protein
VLKLVFSWASLPVVRIQAPLVLKIQQQDFKKLGINQAPEVEAMMKSVEGGLADAAVVAAALWASAYPIFLLIWFGRSKIRREIAGWAGHTLPPRPPGSPEWETM